MVGHQYILQPYKGLTSRFTCPSCGKAREFTRYIDIDTGELFPAHVGRCNREVNCGYHYPPKQYFEDNNTDKQVYFNKTLPEVILKPTSFIAVDIFKQSYSNQKALEQNHFILFLLSLFSYDITNSLIQQFYIGCSKHWKNATVFWQIDTKSKIRSGKIMLYDSKTGKRVKEPYNHIDWVHSVLIKNKIIDEFTLEQCLFGEHQLIIDTSTKPIAIVESEKTAVIASVYLPEFIWLAVGSLSNLTAQKCRVLSGRKVVLFPDLNGYEKWYEKAKQIQSKVNIALTISDFLEKHATEEAKEKGLDLADYLIAQDKSFGWALTENDYPLFWDSKAPSLNEQTFNYL